MDEECKLCKYNIIIEISFEILIALILLIILMHIICIYRKKKKALSDNELLPYYELRYSNDEQCVYYEVSKTCEDTCDGISIISNRSKKCCFCLDRDHSMLNLCEREICKMYICSECKKKCQKLNRPTRCGCGFMIDTT